MLLDEIEAFVTIEKVQVLAAQETVVDWEGSFCMASLW